MKRLRRLMCLFLMSCGIVTTIMADGRGGAEEIPEMLLGVLANAKVSPETPSLLKAVKENPDPTVRWVAIEVLGLRKEKSARETLLRSLKADPDRVVRETAALALARLGEPAGLAALKTFLRDAEDPARQVFLAARLADFGAPDGYEYVVEAAQSKRDSLRAVAAEAAVAFLPFKDLPVARDKAPDEIFLGLSSDANASVRWTVVSFLPSAVAKGLDAGRARSIAQHLAQSDGDPAIRQAAESLLESWRLEKELQP